MGLTNNSTGLGASKSEFILKKQSDSDKIIAVAGNPNVGKSTVFNGITGMKQHTGNWPGKTVTNAQGYFKSGGNSYTIVDIPGTYSLMSNSSDEEAARNFICFGNPDSVVIVCDATCLERNFNLVLQTMEISKNVIVCVNLLDEAERKNIKIDLPLIEKRLGVPVAGVTARKKKTLKTLTDKIDASFENQSTNQNNLKIDYGETIENAIKIIESAVSETVTKENLNPRWISLKLLDYDENLINKINEYLGIDILKIENIKSAIEKAHEYLILNNINSENIKDIIISAVINKASDICSGAVSVQASDEKTYSDLDQKIDRIVSGRKTGYPIMFLLLALVLWLTITGANYPSQLLSGILFRFENVLSDLFHSLNSPEWLHGIIVLGVYRVLAWVISVMLPPMAIFFPLFTLLEDSGYLPRVAYNLDRPFKKCSACGKQSLTMCMGFGCNAAGIVGCRIIDSPRERLIAIITNNFVPCNGRFPILIAVISMFFTFGISTAADSIISSLILTAVVLFGILMTLAVSKILSKTLLKGMPSAFVLELPSYRPPQIGNVLVRSLLDRTIFVLGRAVAAAAPAGLIIWAMANIRPDGISILSRTAGFLDPFAEIIGLDGVIIIAFILGMPANEIVIPIMIMAYMAQGNLVQSDDLISLRQLLTDSGWTWITAVNTMIFSLMHWPCATTLMTIKKETAGIKWVIASFVIPTLCGIIICFILNSAASLINLII